MYHYHRLFKPCNIVLLIIDVSGHVGEGFGDFVWREGEVSLRYIVMPRALQATP